MSQVLTFLRRVEGNRAAHLEPNKSNYVADKAVQIFVCKRLFPEEALTGFLNTFDGIFLPSAPRPLKGESRLLAFKVWVIDKSSLHVKENKHTAK